MELIYWEQNYEAEARVHNDISFFRWLKPTAMVIS